MAVNRVAPRTTAATTHAGISPVFATESSWTTSGGEDQPVHGQGPGCGHGVGVFRFRLMQSVCMNTPDRVDLNRCLIRVSLLDSRYPSTVPSARVACWLRVSAEHFGSGLCAFSVWRNVCQSVFHPEILFLANRKESEDYHTGETNGHAYTWIYRRHVPIQARRAVR